MKKLILLVGLLFLGIPLHATVIMQNISVTFTCTGTVGPFPFNYSISAPNSLTVTQNGVVLATSAYTVKPVNNNYDNGGSVTLVSVCPASQPLVITRTTPLTQTSVFTDNMPNPMKAIENGLDKLTEIVQEQATNGTVIIPGTNINCTPLVSGSCKGAVTVSAQGSGSCIGCITSTPVGGQTVNQPGTTSLEVSSLNAILNEKLFSGGSIAARVNAAATSCGSNPCTIIIPSNETTGTGWTTPLPNTVLLVDQRYTNGQGFADGNTNIRQGEFRTAYYGANLPFETGTNNGRFLLDLETHSVGGTSPANGGGLQIFTERTAGSRPIWSANYNTQVSNLSSTAVGLELDMVNNSGADDTADLMNGIQIEASGNNASGTALFIGAGGGTWEDAVGIFSYKRTGIIMTPLAGRNSDFSIIPPADDSNLEMIGRNHANSANVWTIDDSGNVNTTGHVLGNFIFGTTSGQIGTIYFATGPTSNGLGLMWNVTGGTGESDFVNNHGSGGGGFNWYNSATSTPGSPIMQLSSTGVLASSIFNATTGFQIGGAAPSGHCPVGNGTAYVDSATCGTGAGTVTHTAGALTALKCIIGNGAADITVDPSCSLDGSGNLTVTSVGTGGTTQGAEALGVGTGTITLPAGSPTNYAGWIGPATGTPTYFASLPNANPATAGVMHMAASASLNGVNQAAVTIIPDVANTTITVGNAVSMTANTCSSITGTANTASTLSMTNLATTMTLSLTPTTDVKAVTGWSPGTGGQLYWQVRPSASNTAELYVCNPTTSAIVTGASVTWNVSAK